MFEGIFLNLRNVFKAHQVHVDGKVFKLHYRMTTIALLLACIMVTGRQYFGDPIFCSPASKDEVQKEVLDTYCWIFSTFTLPNAHKDRVGVDVAHPGLRRIEEGEEKKYYSYYQWVCFVLFFQALFFYFPHYLWKCMEKETVKKILLDLKSPVHEDHEKHRKMLTDYLSNTMNRHNWYAYKYFFCEIFNFINVLAQMYLINDFLGGEFLTYGTQVIKMSEWDQGNRTDPMYFVFPRMTKCTFRKFGPTGDIQNHDALCVLPLNVINEKIYILMWFWFVILAAITGIHLMCYLPVVLVPKFRFYLLRMENAFVDPEDICSVMRQAGVGDWLILHFLGMNVDPVQYKLVFQTLAHNLGVESDFKKTPFLREKSKESSA